MPDGIDMVVSLPEVADVALWQEGCAWRNQQDKSQVEAETEVENIRSDKSAANELVMLLMK
jgi:hypothetical protein